MFLYPNQNLGSISKILIMFTVPLLIFKIIPDFYLIDAGSHQETPELIWKGKLILNSNIKP